MVIWTLTATAGAWLVWDVVDLEALVIIGLMGGSVIWAWWMAAREEEERAEVEREVEARWRRAMESILREER